MQSCFFFFCWQYRTNSRWKILSLFRNRKYILLPLMEAHVLWMFTISSCLCVSLSHRLGFSGGSETNAGDAGSIHGSGEILWRRKWQPTPVFLPGRSHRQRNLAGYCPWGRNRVRMRFLCLKNNKGLLVSVCEPLLESTTSCYFRDEDFQIVRIIGCLPNRGINSLQRKILVA